VQAERNHLRTVNCRQQRQLADKANEETQVSHVQPPKPPFSETDECEIKTIASKFTYMSHFWVHSLDKIMKLKLDTDYDPNACFSSTRNKAQGLLLDLCTAIPAKWHNNMSSKSFRSLVSFYLF